VVHVEGTKSGRELKSGWIHKKDKDGPFYEKTMEQDESAFETETPPKGKDKKGKKGKNHKKSSRELKRDGTSIDVTAQSEAEKHVAEVKQRKEEALAVRTCAIDARTIPAGLIIGVRCLFRRKNRKRWQRTRSNS
jgi:hypothetical protein